jgi:hypothetical protein
MEFEGHRVGDTDFGVGHTKKGMFLGNAREDITSTNDHTNVHFRWRRAVHVSTGVPCT